MTAALFYGIFLISCTAYVLWKGGAPERVAIVIAVIASVLSGITASRDFAARYQNIETGMFLVDMITFLAFLLLALRADRFWPIWITGMHLIGVATHAAKLVDPQLVPPVYAFIQGLWAYPILVLIVIGTIRHRKRLRLFGADNSWTASSGRAFLRMLRPGQTG